jgi:hypothetical protein
MLVSVSLPILVYTIFKEYVDINIYKRIDKTYKKIKKYKNNLNSSRREKELQTIIKYWKYYKNESYKNIWIRAFNKFAIVTGTVGLISSYIYNSVPGACVLFVVGSLYTTSIIWRNNTKILEKDYHKKLVESTSTFLENNGIEK